MKRIILIGFMGCGKSSLGKKLAKKLNIPFIDSDSEIEKQYKKSVGEIFGEHGESRFRLMEKEFIHSLSKEKEFVLATGGGMPCHNNVLDDLNELGTTFYLERPAKELANRLANAKSKRPLIEGMTSEELQFFIEEKLEERQEYYRGANIILDRENQEIKAMIEMINLLQPRQID